MASAARVPWMPWVLLLASSGVAQCKRRAPEPAPTGFTEIAPLVAAAGARGFTTVPAASPLAPGPSSSILAAPSIARAAPIDAATSTLSTANAATTDAAPVADAKPPSATVRFAAIGDYGADTAGEGAVAAMVKSWAAEFIITLGDNNYPTGDAATIDANIGKYYAGFIGNYRGRFGPGSAENRFWPSPGNHDWIAGLSPYLAYFTLPGNERYYDVDLGLVHIYALDSDSREPDGIAIDSQQATWLKQRLGASKACYDVVYFHHPAYSTSEHGSALPLRWPFKKWGAEVVIAGHDHTYERLDVDGIPYFVNGLGGASKYEFPLVPLAETRFRYNEEFGAMRVTATHADIRYEFLTIDGKKRDTLTVPGSCP